MSGILYQEEALVAQCLVSMAKESHQPPQCDEPMAMMDDDNLEPSSVSSEEEEEEVEHQQSHQQDYSFDKCGAPLPNSNQWKQEKYSSARFSAAQW